LPTVAVPRGGRDDNDDLHKERRMLISIWWALGAFILGGTTGVIALGVFAGGRLDLDHESADHPMINPTQ
jgi:hypothetical protein